MVLESLMNPITAEKRPYEMFFIGFLYSSIAIVLSLWVFKSQSSIVMVLLTVLACVPLMYNTIKYEASKKESKEIFLLREHTRALYFFVFLSSINSLRVLLSKIGLLESAKIENGLNIP